MYIRELVEKMSKLEIDPNFKENPAYEATLEEINSRINWMYQNIKNEQAVRIQEEPGIISFSGNLSSGEKHSIDISCFDPETFRCIESRELVPFRHENGQLVRQKSVHEIVATIDKSTGCVIIAENHSLIDNRECKVGKCNNTTYGTRKVYSRDGIMVEREHKRFPTGDLNQGFDRTTIEHMLYIPRAAFRERTFENSYNYRELYVRKQLDTARAVIEDKDKEIKYNATVPLSREHGLRDIIAIDGDPYPQEIVIPPLSQEQIEEMIQQETNPKVAEGLRKYAVGRDTYFYNSANDKNFVSEGVTEQRQSIYR